MILNISARNQYIQQILILYQFYLLFYLLYFVSIMYIKVSILVLIFLNNYFQGSITLKY